MREFIMRLDGIVVNLFQIVCRCVCGWFLWIQHLLDTQQLSKLPATTVDLQLPSTRAPLLFCDVVCLGMHLAACNLFQPPPLFPSHLQRRALQQELERTTKELEQRMEETRAEHQHLESSAQNETSAAKEEVKALNVRARRSLSA